MKVRAVIALTVAAAVGAAPVVAWATSTRAGSGTVQAVANREKGVWRAAAVTTQKSAFQPLTGLQAKVCASGEVAATVSVDASGGPMALQVHLDDGALLAPGAVTFAPGSGGSLASFTFLTSVSAFEGYDTHLFQVEWRSTTGTATTVRSGTMNLLYQEGTHRC